MKKGFRLLIKNGKYKPLTITHQSPKMCWEDEFKEALRSAQCAIKEDVFPEVEFDGESVVVFRKYNTQGREILGKSSDIRKCPVSKKEIRRLEKVLAKLHETANDPEMPTDKRDFFKNFRLPDPMRMPECWRVTGLFKKRLYILWGLDRAENGGTFLPASKRTNDLEDASQRQSVETIIDSIHEQNGSSNVNQDGMRTSDGDSVEGEERKGGEYVKEASTSSRGKSCLSKFLDFLLWLIFLGIFLLLLNVVCPLKGCRMFNRSNGDVSAEKIKNERVGEINNPPQPLPNDGEENDTPRPSDPGSNGAASNQEDVTGDGKKGWQSAPEGEDEASNQGEPSNKTDGENGSAEGESGKHDVSNNGTVGGSRDNRKQPSGRSHMLYSFKVVASIKTQIESSNFANVCFTVTPLVDLNGVKPIVSDWTVNQKVEQCGVSETFSPRSGLSYDKTYLISATVEVNGEKQRVEPYQWNALEEPTWQIIDRGRDETSKMRRYEVVCTNSSLITPNVLNWDVKFRSVASGEPLDFEFQLQESSDTEMGLKRNIAYYEGAYLLNLSAQIQYQLPSGAIREKTHEEVLPYSHDSSADSLTTAKYEVVIPHVYFCLATLTDGSSINGTAFAISETQLLTNYHVAVGGIPERDVDGASYTVKGPVTLLNGFGKTYYANVEYKNREQDVVILKLCNQEGAATSDKMPGYLHLAADDVIRSITPEQKRSAIAIGYPRGTVCKGPPAFTEGNAEEVKRRNGVETIVHYTNIKHGYSGGPLIDYQTGTVLGINFGGLIKKEEQHKPASLATSVSEVRDKLSRE